MDTDRLKLALRENLRIKLEVEPLEIPICNINGDVFGIERAGNKVRAILYWKEDGEILSGDEIEIKK